MQTGRNIEGTDGPQKKGEKQQEGFFTFTLLTVPFSCCVVFLFLISLFVSQDTEAGMFNNQKQALIFASN